MVKADRGPPMKIATVDEAGVAECIAITEHGEIRLHHYHVGALTAVRDSLGPRSCWPETNESDLAELEREERWARAERKAKRKASNKPKAKSRRIKR